MKDGMAYASELEVEAMYDGFRKLSEGCCYMEVKISDRCACMLNPFTYKSYMPGIVQVWRKYSVSPTWITR